MRIADALKIAALIYPLGLIATTLGALVMTKTLHPAKAALAYHEIKAGLERKVDNPFWTFRELLWFVFATPAALSVIGAIFGLLGVWQWPW